MAYTNKTTLPSCSRILERKWDERKLQAHHSKLRNIKPTIDTRPPKEHAHIRQNLRKAQMQEERWAFIERQNKELLGKMNHILHTTGRVDHRNLDWKPKRSLNFARKKEETERIMKENETILRRIQSVKPLYNVKSWEADFQCHQSKVKSLSMLPPMSHARRSRTLPNELKVCSIPKLPPIATQHRAQSSDGPETQSDIQEEIDVELPAAELKITKT